MKLDPWVEMTRVRPLHVGSALYAMSSPVIGHRPEVIAAAFAVGLLAFTKMYPTSMPSDILATAENILQRTHGQDEDARVLSQAIALIKGEFRG